MSFNLGAVVPLSVTVTDSTGAPANAGAVTVTITLPDNTIATPAVTNVPPGVYNADFPTTQAGRHSVRWVATGANASAYTDVFEVLPAIPPQIFSLEDGKAQLNIPPATTAYDAEIAEFIRATTAVVERYTGQIVRTAYTETFDGGQCRLMLRHYPVLSITSVTENGTILDPSGYTFTPASGLLIRINGLVEWSFLPGVQNVTVAYIAGTTTTTPNVRQAASIILQHLWETQRPTGRGPFDQRGEEFDPRFLYSIPRRALELLGDPVSGIA